MHDDLERGRGKSRGRDESVRTFLVQAFSKEGAEISKWGKLRTPFDRWEGTFYT